MIHTKKILLLSALLITAAAPREPMIIRHDVDPSKYFAEASDYPSLFGLYIMGNGAPVCVATIINESWAITAAHCTQSERLQNQIASGEGYSVTVNGKPMLLDGITHHPTWTGRANSTTFDMALLHFKTPVSDITPIDIYRDTDEVGKVVSMLGWGGTGTGLTGVKGNDAQFRYAENLVDAANDIWIDWDFDNPEENPDKVLPLEGISGPGDSGGPAFIKVGDSFKIAGISSHQITRGQPEGSYGVTERYTRVSSAVEWIESTINSCVH